MRRAVASTTIALVLLAAVGVAQRLEPARARVLAVHPSAAVVPSNLLRFYIEFSAPMREDVALEYVRLVDDSGHVVSKVFLELREELWDPSRRRLTLLLDPGRIKRGLRSHNEMGPALVEGRAYRLVVDSAWRDANGNTLAGSYEQRFRVGAFDDTPPQPEQWEIDEARVATRQPIRVRFPDALDHALAATMLRIVDAERRPIEGVAALTEDDRVWTFTPTAPWRNAELQIEVDNRLEDLAGNNLARPFDVDRLSEDAQPASEESRFLPIRLLMARAGHPQQRPSLAVPPSLHADSLGDGGPATRARLVTPVQLARDTRGNLYVSERGAHRIRRIDASGVINTFAGSPEGRDGAAGDGGPARSALLSQPDGLALGPDGSLYIGDVGNNRVRRVDGRTGIITTVAGTGEAGFSGDGGPATAAKLNGPFGLAVDPTGNLYITDTENQRIRKVDAVTGVITTIAGNGVWDFAGDGGPATEASFARPHILLADGDSALIVGDSFNQRIRRISLRSGTVRTIAGTGLRGSRGEGGPAADASFMFFGSIVFDRHRNLNVVSLGTARIVSIDSRTGHVRRVAGDGFRRFAGDGGPAERASLHLPVGLVADESGNLFVADMWNGRIRRIDARTGIITSIAGSAPSPPTPAVAWDFYYNADSTRAILDQPVRFTLPGMENVRVQRDVIYGRGRFSRADVYSPARGEPTPVIVVVPGPNDVEIRAKDNNGFASWGRLIAAAGMTAVVMDHSLGTRGRSLELASRELDEVFRYLRSQSSALGVDASRICIMAFAGSASLTAPIVRDRGGARCLVLQYPHVDLFALEQFSSWAIESEAVRARFSLNRELPSSTMPVLLIAAGREQPVIRSAIDSLRTRLRSPGSVTVLEHAAGRPGFERTLADDRTRDIARQTLCFLQTWTEVARTQC